MSKTIKLEPSEVANPSDLGTKLTHLTTRLQEMEKVLKGNKSDDGDALDHIELMVSPAEVDIRVLSKYIDGLQRESDQHIEDLYAKFVHEHNNVLFHTILPRIELLNELHKYISITDRKLGEAERVQVIGRINSVIQQTKPVLRSWLGVQKDLQSRLQFEKGMVGGGSDTWQATHIDPFTNSSSGKIRMKLEGENLKKDDFFTLPKSALVGANRKKKTARKRTAKRK